MPWLLMLMGITIFVCGCQIKPKPTEVFETKEIDYKVLREKYDQPLHLSEESIILDTRDAFDFTMTHIPHSIRLQGDEFIVKNGRSKGYLKDSLLEVTQRLSRLGVNKNSQVVVVGDFKEGRAGFLAWILLYLGVKDVQVSHVSYFDRLLTNVVTIKPKKKIESWDPEKISSTMVGREQFRKIIRMQKEAKRVVIIDVRSKKKFSLSQKKEGSSGTSPVFTKINIPWREFYTDKGRINGDLNQRLKRLGISFKDQIVVVSERGKRSGAVVWPLLSLGYLRVSHYLGGYAELSRKTVGHF